MKLVGNFTSNGPGSENYLFGNMHLSARAGVDGFVSRGESWAVDSLFSDRSNNPSYLKYIDPSLSLCLRVFLKDLGRIAIPQLALYPPESGYPLCKPEKSHNYKAGDRAATYTRFFFTIPMTHVNYGLATGACSNVYTTFFSNAFEKKNPLTHISEMSKYPPNYLTFPTGKNFIDLGDTKKYPSTWTEEMDLTDDMALDVCMVAGSGPRKVMPHDAFARYLPYYYWYYPVTMFKLKGHTYGSAGTTEGAYQGNLKYYSYNEDAFVGSGYIWKRYFGLSEDYNWATGLTLGWSTLNFNYTNVSDYSAASSDYQLMYSGIPSDVMQEFAIIRAAIQNSSLSRQFKYFPFSAKSKKKDFGRTKIEASCLKKVSSIIQISSRLNAYSRVDYVKDRKCPMCSQALLLPEVLITKGVSKETMCVPCGFKVLNNMHYLAVRQVNPSADTCMWSDDVDMSAALNESMIVKTPEQSVIGK